MNREDLKKSAANYKEKGSEYLEYIEKCTENLKQSCKIIERLNEFQSLYEDFSVTAKADYFLTKEKLKSDAEKNSEKPSEILKYIENRLSDLKAALEQERELSVQRKIDRKIEAYFFLWEEQNKPKDCISYDNLRRKCQSEGFYSKKSEEIIDLHTAKLKAKIANG